MITLVSSVLGTLSDDEARAVGSAGRRLASRLLRLGRPRHSGADIVAALIHQVLGDPGRPLPRCQGEVDQMVVVLRKHLPALARAAGGPRRLAILGGPVPTDDMGSRVQLILLAETARHLTAARPWVNSTIDHPTNGAGASARQYTPVNAVRRCPPSGSESRPEEGPCRLVAAASGRPERGAVP